MSGFFHEQWSLLVGEAQADVGPDDIFLVDLLQGFEGDGVVHAGEDGKIFVQRVGRLRAELEVVPAGVIGIVVAEVQSEKRVGLEADDVLVDGDVAVQAQFHEAAGVVIEVPDEIGAGNNVGNEGRANGNEELVAVSVVHMAAVVVTALFGVFLFTVLFLGMFFATMIVSTHCIGGDVAEIVAGNDEDRAEVDVVSDREIPFRKSVAGAYTIPNVDINPFPSLDPL